jgi:predicted HTH transcriptional regulator
MLEQITTLLRSWRQSPPQIPIREYPRGKLGKIIEHLSSSGGTTIEDLMALTGWQRRTVHAGLSRLRKRGFVIKPRKKNGQTIYFLGGTE